MRLTKAAFVAVPGSTVLQGGEFYLTIGLQGGCSVAELVAEWIMSLEDISGIV